MGRNYIGDIPNPHIRDFQRKRLYQAEKFCSFWDNLKILSTEEVESLVHDIANYFNIKTPKILNEGHNYVYATQNVISLPYPNTKTLPYILHEMSHVINYNSDFADHHGKYFGTTYLKVVRHFSSISDYKELKHSLNKHKVQYLTD